MPKTILSEVLELDEQLNGTDAVNIFSSLHNQQTSMSCRSHPLLRKEEITEKAFIEFILL
jgi:hypothetical protein